jgi:hypothetical protein
MGQTLPKEESMPVVSALEMLSSYLPFTQHSAWHPVFCVCAFAIKNLSGDPYAFKLDKM